MTPANSNCDLHVDRVSAGEARAYASRGISGGVAYYSWVVSGVEDAIRKSGAILDLGCGVGLLGEFLRKYYRCEVHGLDIVRHEGFREEDYASFELRNLETLLPGGPQFDVILAIGLIEYLPNPRSFIRSLPALLTPNGKVVVTCPNPSSLLNLGSLLLRGEFSAFRESSNPASITPVLAVDASRMFREAGFCRVEVDFSEAWRIPLSRAMCYRDVFPFLLG